MVISHLHPSSIRPNPWALAAIVGITLACTGCSSTPKFDARFGNVVRQELGAQVVSSERVMDSDGTQPTATETERALHSHIKGPAGAPQSVSPAASTTPR